MSAKSFKAFGYLIPPVNSVNLECVLLSLGFKGGMEGYCEWESPKIGERSATNYPSSVRTDD